MKIAVKQLLILPLLLITISCGEEKKDLEAAKFFYTSNYWMITGPYESAFWQMEQYDNAVMNDMNNCGYEIAAEALEKILDARELLEIARAESAELIADRISADELHEANDYYKNTQLGKLISMQAGIADLTKNIQNSPFFEEMSDKIAAAKDSSEKYQIVVEYALKVLPKTETEKYLEFTELPVWEDIHKLKPEMDNIMRDFIVKATEAGKSQQTLYSKCPTPPEGALVSEE